jgi:hypothetical protein
MVLEDCSEMCARERRLWSGRGPLQAVGAPKGRRRPGLYLDGRE